MNDATHIDQRSATHRFVTESDWIPEFWNYLLGLDPEDLIAELIQNDLDQGATVTQISFEPDCLVCEGNGRSVDASGWKRLRMIRGAGDTVAAKRGKIGVKNHGLKAAFTIGDEIRLSSDGRSVVQTLFAKGRANSPYPGASAAPIRDPQAPDRGCRVTIVYRTTDIEPRQGEAITLGAVAATEIDRLFRSACSTIPEQFSGIVSPEVAPNYEIQIKHWRLGHTRFQFSCTPPKMFSRGIKGFRRRCRISGTVADLPKEKNELAFRRALPLHGRLRERVPDFYRLGDKFFVEVSWPVDRRGAPTDGIGRYRYPIGYPATSTKSNTGHSVFYNAPLVSDTERHGPAKNDPTNEEVLGACRELLFDVLTRYALPKWRTRALNQIAPTSPTADAAADTKLLLASLAAGNALPTLRWSEVVSLQLKGKAKRAKAASLKRLERAEDKHPNRYNFIIPIATWDEDKIRKALAIVAPRNERQLDPKIDPALLALLVDQEADGFGTAYITFDQNDAIARVAHEGNSYFDGSDTNLALSDPLIATSYLSVVHESITHGKCNADEQQLLQERMKLPDTQNTVHSFSDLHAGANVPLNVPGLTLPPIIHDELAPHPLLRRNNWRIPTYSLTRFLENKFLEDADVETRRSFWRWIQKNPHTIKPRNRATLATLPIWPDEDNYPVALAELCEPRSKHVAEILGESIRRPHSHVLKSKLTTLGTRSANAIRQTPSFEEIQDYLERAFQPYEKGERIDPAELENFERIEADVASLARDPNISRHAKQLSFTMPAVALDSTVQKREALVARSRSTLRLELLPRFLLRTSEDKSLNKIWPALDAPTAEMLLLTLQEDAARHESLQPRLAAILSATDLEEEHLEQLRNLSIIPIGSDLHPPSQLAFQDKASDFWGEWKTKVSPSGLSQDDQDRYRKVGVLSSKPSRDSSLEFFRWLFRQDEALIGRHLDCVFRHILHPSGPESWAKIYTDIPFVPVRSSEGIELVSLKAARSRPIYIADEKSLAESILQKDPGVRLAIERLEGLAQPITESLRRLDVKSLREAIGDPEVVRGIGPFPQSLEGAEQLLSTLHSDHFRDSFLKRLDDLGVDPKLLRYDWKKRTRGLRKIRQARSLEAIYRLRRKAYRVQMTAGFDPPSGTLWIGDDSAPPISLACEAIAAQLVFRSGTRPIHLLSLERALFSDAFDQGVRVKKRQQTPIVEPNSADDSATKEPGKNQSPDPPLGEAIFGHAPFSPDESRNAPHPSPLRTTPPTAGRSRNAGPSAGNRSGASEPLPKEDLLLEEDHIESLKRDHYASHCQMCLCHQSPQDLAPKRSYIEWEEVRRRVVEAHHVDLKSAGGARHAGNLILLCKLHHDNYGRRLNRSLIIKTLQERAVAKSITFDENKSAVISGLVVTLLIPDTGDEVELFFTDEHAAFWLNS